MQGIVDTAKLKDRRTLRFITVEEALADIDRIVASDKAGTLRCAGNWTAGQNFGHVAAWINFAYEGFPLKPPPLPIRLILKFMKGKYLRNGLPAGVKIPGVAAGTFAFDPLTTEEGAARLKKALLRLKSNEPAPHDSPAFGKMSHEDRVALNLRHAELHLSFLLP